MLDIKPHVPSECASIPIPSPKHSRSNSPHLSLGARSLRSSFSTVGPPRPPPSVSRLLLKPPPSPRPPPPPQAAASSSSSSSLGRQELAMEHGSLTDARSSTFCILDEDHTFANSVRFTLNQDPRVAFCGYSIPHPSDNKVNIRVQTTGDPARDVFKDALQGLMVMCQHIRTTFDQAVDDFKAEQSPEDMQVESRGI
ncbi:uncharacterized protein [Typha angustifolia]|uniref:uncharacterized protein isoform X2 n=1 Tax=Typha angustifolia TaxID=59011 RepID=UPI003C2F53DF